EEITQTTRLPVQNKLHASHTFIYTRAQKHTLTHSYTHAYRNTLTHTHIHIHTGTETHTHTHTHTHTELQAHTHTHTHTHTQITLIQSPSPLTPGHFYTVRTVPTSQKQSICDSHFTCSNTWSSLSP